jgi:hypothetical protein
VAAPAAPSSYLLATDDLTTSGPWEFTVTAVRPQLTPAIGAFTWVVAPSAVVVRRPFVSPAPLTPYAGWMAGAVLVLGATAMALLLRRRSRRRPPEPATPKRVEPSKLHADVR